MILLITFLFVAVIGKLIYIQIIEGANLQARALDQWTRDIPITGERGDIFDKNGLILADAATTYTVYARPVSVSDKAACAYALASVLSLDGKKLYDRMNSRVSELTVAKKVTKEQMNALKANGNVTGVYFSPTIARSYPYGDFMTQLLGFTNIDGVGQTGVEAYYNEYLQGVNGYALTETDLVGRELEKNVTSYVYGKKGGSVYLTLDYYIQAFVESAVKSAYAKYSAKSVSCVVMNTETGAILALAQSPSFDLNNVPRDNVTELFGNSKSILVSNVYEPGSTFKILTTAMGLDSGVIDRNYNFYCPGYRIVDGKKIRCWKTAGHGSEHFDEGVQNSCNCLFMDIAGRLGTERFYNGINKFGLTVKTGIDVSGESSGLTIKQDTVKSVDLARMGFGQAIAVTPIELITACSAVVNGGKLMTPYVLDRVEMNGKTTYKNYPIQRASVISEATSAAMREILEKVVSDGSGRNAAVSGYRISGKTGTAQKYADGVIAHGKYLSTFIGFAPANAPRYSVLFMVDEPQGYVYYGSLVAAPYVGEIFEKILTYDGEERTKTEAAELFAMPDITGMTAEQAVKILREKNMYFETSGEGLGVISQIPVAGATVDKNTVVLITLG